MRVTSTALLASALAFALATTAPADERVQPVSASVASALFWHGKSVDIYAGNALLRPFLEVSAGRVPMPPTLEPTRRAEAGSAASLHTSLGAGLDLRVSDAAQLGVCVAYHPTLEPSRSEDYGSVAARVRLEF